MDSIIKLSIHILSEYKKTIDEVRDQMEAAKQLSHSIEILEVTINMIPMRGDQDKVKKMISSFMPPSVGGAGTLGLEAPNTGNLSLVTPPRSLGKMVGIGARNAKRMMQQVGKSSKLLGDLERLVSSMVDIGGSSNVVNGFRPAEILQGMRARGDSDLQISFTAMGFLVYSALKIIGDALKDIYQLNTPDLYMFLMPWKLLAQKQAGSAIVGHIEAINKLNLQLQNAIGIASYCISLEQLENVLDATSVLVNKSVRDFWKKKIGISNVKVKMETLTESFLNHVGKDIKAYKIANYHLPEKYVNMRDIPQVAMARFISHLFNTNGDDWLTVFEMNTNTESCGKDTDVVKHSWEKIRELERMFYSQIEFLPLDLSQSDSSRHNHHDSKKIPNLEKLGKSYSFTNLKRGGCNHVQDLVKKNIEKPTGVILHATDMVVTVQPFERLTILCKVPRFNKSLYPHDSITLLKYENVHDVKHLSTTNNREFLFKEIDGARAYLTFASNREFYQHDLYAWNAPEVLSRNKDNNTAEEIVVNDHIVLSENFVETKLFPDSDGFQDLSTVAGVADTTLLSSREKIEHSKALEYKKLFNDGGIMSMCTMLYTPVVRDPGFYTVRLALDELKIDPTDDIYSVPFQKKRLISNKNYYYNRSVEEHAIFASIRGSMMTTSIDGLGLANFKQFIHLILALYDLDMAEHAVIIQFNTSKAEASRSGLDGEASYDGFASANAQLSSQNSIHYEKLNAIQREKENFVKANQLKVQEYIEKKAKKANKVGENEDAANVDKIVESGDPFDVSTKDNGNDKVQRSKKLQSQFSADISIIRKFLRMKSKSIHSKKDAHTDGKLDPIDDHNTNEENSLQPVDDLRRRYSLADQIEIDDITAQRRTKYKHSSESMGSNDPPIHDGLSNSEKSVSVNLSFLSTYPGERGSSAVLRMSNNPLNSSGVAKDATFDDNTKNTGCSNNILELTDEILELVLKIEKHVDDPNLFDTMVLAVPDGSCFDLVDHGPVREETATVPLPRKIGIQQPKRKILGTMPLSLYQQYAIQVRQTVEYVKYHYPVIIKNTLHGSGREQKNADDLEISEEERIWLITQSAIEFQLDYKYLVLQKIMILFEWTKLIIQVEEYIRITLKAWRNMLPFTSPFILHQVENSMKEYKGLVDEQRSLKEIIMKMIESAPPATLEHPDKHSVLIDFDKDISTSIAQDALFIEGQPGLFRQFYDLKRSLYLLDSKEAVERLDVDRIIRLDNCINMLNETAIKVLGPKGIVKKSSSTASTFLRALSFKRSSNNHDDNRRCLFDNRTSARKAIRCFLSNLIQFINELNTRLLQEERAHAHEYHGGLTANWFAWKNRIRKCSEIVEEFEGWLRNAGCPTLPSSMPLPSPLISMTANQRKSLAITSTFGYSAGYMGANLAFDDEELLHNRLTMLQNQPPISITGLGDDLYRSYVELELEASQLRIQNFLKFYDDNLNLQELFSQGYLERADQSGHSIGHTANPVPSSSGSSSAQILATQHLKSFNEIRATLTAYANKPNVDKNYIKELKELLVGHHESHLSIREHAVGASAKSNGSVKTSTKNDNEISTSFLQPLPSQFEINVESDTKAAVDCIQSSNDLSGYSELLKSIHKKIKQVDKYNKSHIFNSCDETEGSHSPGSTSKRLFFVFGCMPRYHFWSFVKDVENEVNEIESKGSVFDELTQKRLIKADIIISQILLIYKCSDFLIKVDKSIEDRLKSFDHYDQQSSVMLDEIKHAIQDRDVLISKHAILLNAVYAQIQTEGSSILKSVDHMGSYLLDLQNQDSMDRNIDRIAKDTLIFQDTKPELFIQYYVLKSYIYIVDAHESMLIQDWSRLYQIECKIAALNDLVLLTIRNKESAEQNNSSAKQSIPDVKHSEDHPPSTMDSRQIIKRIFEQDNFLTFDKQASSGTDAHPPRHDKLPRVFKDYDRENIVKFVNDFIQDLELVKSRMKEFRDETNHEKWHRSRGSTYGRTSLSRGKSMNHRALVVLESLRMNGEENARAEQLLIRKIDMIQRISHMHELINHLSEIQNRAARTPPPTPAVLWTAPSSQSQTNVNAPSKQLDSVVKPHGLVIHVKDVNALAWGQAFHIDSEYNHICSRNFYPKKRHSKVEKGRMENDDSEGYLVDDRSNHNWRPLVDLYYPYNNKKVLDIKRKYLTDKEDTKASSSSTTSTTGMFPPMNPMNINKKQISRSFSQSTDCWNSLSHSSSDSGCLLENTRNRVPPTGQQDSSADDFDAIFCIFHHVVKHNGNPILVDSHRSKEKPVDSESDEKDQDGVVQPLSPKSKDGQPEDSSIKRNNDNDKEIDSRPVDKYHITPTHVAIFSIKQSKSDVKLPDLSVDDLDLRSGVVGVAHALSGTANHTEINLKSMLNRATLTQKSYILALTSKVDSQDVIVNDSPLLQINIDTSTAVGNQDELDSFNHESALGVVHGIDVEREHYHEQVADHKYLEKYRNEIHSRKGQDSM